MTDALAATGPDWASMTHEHRGPVLADYIIGFGRHTLKEFWIIGRGLEAHATGLNRGDGSWYAYLDRIGMKPAQASELRRLARGFATFEELLRHRTKDLALKALKEPASTTTPTAEIQRSTVEPVEPEPEAVIATVVEHPEQQKVKVVEVVEHPEQQKVVEVVEVVEDVIFGDLLIESDAEAVRLRADRLERIAIRVEHEDGAVVDVLGVQLDRADARDRDRVQTIRAERRRRIAAERHVREMTDALLVAPLCECGSGAAHDAGVLAKFRGVQRQAPAA